MITRPLRIATRGAQITLHGAHEAIEVAEGLLGLVAARLSGNGHHDVPVQPTGSEPAAWRGPAASSTSAPADAPAPAAEADAPAPAAPSAPGPGAPAPAESASAAAAPPAAPVPPPAEEIVDAEPVHVSAEPELVDEVSDPGAEEGAGAELHIAEPWEGYRTMKAADIIDRLATASREQVAAVELYELSGRKRKSVLAAAQRALKRASPPR